MLYIYAENKTNEIANQEALRAQTSARVGNFPTCQYLCEPCSQYNLNKPECV